MKFEPELLEAIDRATEHYVAVHDEIQSIWAEQMVFTWHWWFDVALAVLPWILWFIVRDRKNTHNLLYAGFFSMLAAAILDVIGVSQGGWNYDTWLLPYLPEYLPWDLTVMPVTAMLFYQFFPKINPWIKGVFFGVVAAYVVEPIFIWLGLYEPTAWKHHYSLPIYFVIYMIGYWFYTRKRDGYECSRN
ncbi:MAG TPA: CBO0543 family protein [Clostridia bacterium]|nr:CBO0543 family protein [Clostridia bacterium]